LFAGGGTEEAELGGLTDGKRELAVRHLGRGAFFHAELRYGEGLERSFNAGDGGHGGFDADVVGARNAAANADAFAVPGGSVVGCAAGYGVHEIFAGEDLDIGGFVERRCGSVPVRCRTAP